MASENSYLQIVDLERLRRGDQHRAGAGYGYRYLEMIQDARRGAAGEPFPYRSDDLRLPVRIHGLRKRGADRKAVDEAAKLLSGGDGAGAARRLDALDASAPKPGGPPR